ncbi:hypothetical protein AAFF_G00066960 [Aldrovandia affinis]|uniref:Uncharacterized protein n=1 Tax=Aldrovandia affinis TaxID=143900 RepID=A0AAD7T4B1_9TELE|nr:hypothetical protein AAFF_G00066960 [Aldrovandia affinis]
MREQDSQQTFRELSLNTESPLLALEARKGQLASPHLPLERGVSAVSSKRSSHGVRGNGSLPSPISRVAKGTSRAGQQKKHLMAHWNPAPLVQRQTP